MKKRIVICLGAMVCLLAGCHKPVILVDKIEFNPTAVKMFPGEEQEISLNCYPADATNLDELTVSLSKPEVANFENGKLLAKTAGKAILKATCGEAWAQADVTVYSGWFTKGDKKYGVDKATGYYYLMGESTPQSLELTLTFVEGHEQDWDITQNFWFTIPCDRLGQTVDFLEDMTDCMAAVYKNNNEDGYTVAYFSEDLCRPVIKLADWGETDATLTKGLLTVTQTGTNTFKVLADFALSNGYTFTADWEGPATMQQQ